MISLFDAEANGLLDTVTRAWCVVIKDIETLKVCEYGPDQIQQALDHLQKSDWILGHNIVAYDLPMFEKCYGWKTTSQVFDTVVLSRVLWPDRPYPKNTIRGEKYNAKNGKPHSIGAWGWRLGRFKPEHEDWSKFSPEMLHRCREDVEINHDMIDYLLDKEAKCTIQELLA